MPGETRDLKVRWLGDATSLSRSAKTAASAVEGAGKKITSTGSSIGGAFGKLGSLLGTFNVPFAGAARNASKDMAALETAGVDAGEGIGAGMTAGLAVAGSAAIEFGRESVQAAAAYEKAHEKLSVVVTNTGGDMKQLEGSIKGADQKMVDLGFSSTETETSLASLTPAAHGVQNAIKLEGLAADIARAKGETLADATSLLVQVEAGRFRGLTKLGIATKDVNGKTITSQAAIQKLTDLFGGAASEYAGTFAGKLAVLKAHLDEIKVTVGEQLLPSLSDGATILSDLSKVADHSSSSLVGLGDRVSRPGADGAAQSRVVHRLDHRQQTRERHGRVVDQGSAEGDESVRR
jgi:hypothetical protein